MPSIPELEAIRRPQILDAALDTIARSGSANVTMDDIARAAGLSKGGLAHYYKSKQSLFLAAFSHFFVRIFERSRQTLLHCKTTEEKILSFQWLYDANDPDMTIGYPVLLDFMSIAAHDSDYQAMFYQWVDQWVGFLSEALQEGIDSGTYSGLDPDSVARTISAVYQGIALRWYLAPKAHSTKWAIDSLKTAVRGLLAPYRQ